MRTLSIALILLVACGPGKGGSSGTETVGTGGASTGDTSAGSPTTDMPTGPTSDTPTAGTTGDTPTGATGEPASCEKFLPDEIGPGVSITLVHAGTTPVFVPAASCAGLPRIKILDASNQDYFSAGSDCSPSMCEEFMSLDVCEVGCDDCGAPSVGRLEPGAKFTVVWPGARGVELQIGADCAPGTDCQGACLRATRAGDGDYQIELPAFRACTGGCACDGNPQNGWCPIFDAADVSEPISFTATLAYPAQTEVEVTVTDP